MAYRNDLSIDQIDTIGEIINISMGAGATALSQMVGRSVSITTPAVSLSTLSEKPIRKLEPAVGALIRYAEGIVGDNYFVLKQEDIKYIIDILRGGDGSDLEFEMDDFFNSAFGEIMNQMMGASCTALANFFGRTVNISTPQMLEFDDEGYVRLPMREDETVVVIRFALDIEDRISSEFVSIMEMEFAKELVQLAVRVSMDSVATMEPEPPAPVKQAPVAPPPAAPAAPAHRAAPAAPPQQQYAQPTRSTPVNVSSVSFANFEDEVSPYMLPEDKQPNYNRILNVPLAVCVEIGRTKKLVKDILDITQGTIIELDKQAGDLVDVIVNGQLIAKGEIVVIDDNFGVRITELAPSRDLVSGL